MAEQHNTTPRRAVDTAYRNAPCWIGYEWPDSALIVYDDQPDAIAITDNQPGRFAPTK